MIDYLLKRFRNFFICCFKQRNKIKIHPEKFDFNKIYISTRENKFVEKNYSNFDVLTPQPSNQKDYDNKLKLRKLGLKISYSSSLKRKIISSDYVLIDFNKTKALEKTKKDRDENFPKTSH